MAPSRHQASYLHGRCSWWAAARCTLLGAAGGSSCARCQAPRAQHRSRPLGTQAAGLAPQLASGLGRLPAQGCPGAAAVLRRRRLPRAFRRVPLVPPGSCRAPGAGDNKGWPPAQSRFAICSRAQPHARWTTSQPPRGRRAVARPGRGGDAHQHSFLSQAGPGRGRLASGASGSPVHPPAAFHGGEGPPGAHSSSVIDVSSHGHHRSSQRGAGLGRARPALVSQQGRRISGLPEEPLRPVQQGGSASALLRPRGAPSGCINRRASVAPVQPAPDLSTSASRRPAPAQPPPPPPAAHRAQLLGGQPQRPALGDLHRRGPWLRGGGAPCAGSDAPRTAQHAPQRTPRPWLPQHECVGRGAVKTVYKAFDEEEGMEVAWNEVHCPQSALKDK